MKTYSIAFIFAAICFVIGIVAIVFTWNTLFSYDPEIPGGGSSLMLPDPYDREAAELVLITLLNSYSVGQFPVFGTAFGSAIILLGLVCLWLGFALRGYEKRIEALEKK